MVREGSKVRLKAEAPLRLEHPELANAIGIVSSIVHGPKWSRLSSSQAERSEDTAVHVRFAPPVNLVLLNAKADLFEEVDDGLEPQKLKIVGSKPKA